MDLFSHEPRVIAVGWDRGRLLDWAAQVDNYSRDFIRGATLALQNSEQQINFYPSAAYRQLKSTMGTVGQLNPEFNPDHRYRYRGISFESLDFINGLLSALVTFDHDLGPWLAEPIMMGEKSLTLVVPKISKIPSEKL